MSDALDRLAEANRSLLENYTLNIENFCTDLFAGEEISEHRITRLELYGQLISVNSQIIHLNRGIPSDRDDLEFHRNWEVMATEVTQDKLQRITDALTSIQYK